VILTQNAFADARYQEYIRFLYGDRLQLPSQRDVDSAFQEYITDAQVRLEHDQRFPNEPKQIRGQEQLKNIDGKLQASGVDAVMDINERVLQFILEKNPSLSFALEESFPMKSTYEAARPLGPILELRAEDSRPALDQAQQTVEFWRDTASRLLQDSEASQSGEVLNTWSKMIVGQANLLAHNNQSTEAEEAYRLALQMAPRNTDAVIALSRHYENSARAEAARALVKEFAGRNPDLQRDLDRFLPQFK
jgi:tetratricopeptide (TPR) repeat protein